MKGQILRVYADTSVFGGAFDEEFRGASRDFFDQVRRGRFELVTSAVVQQEVAAAPARVRNLFDAILPLTKVAAVTEETLRLQAAYLSAGILPPKWAADALHVALATTSRASLIVSWNFAHIVHFDKIFLYNEVNAREGHAAIAIHSPLEVISYEDQDL